MFSFLLFFPLCFENMRRRRREKKNRNTHQNIFLSFKNAKQNRRNGKDRRATISRMGALRDSSTGTALTLPKTAELRTSAVGRREQVKKTKI